MQVRGNRRLLTLLAVPLQGPGEILDQIKDLTVTRAGGRGDRAGTDPLGPQPSRAAGWEVGLRNSAASREGATPKVRL